MPYATVKHDWESKPLYQHLRGITSNYAEVSNIVDSSVEEMCGHYLTNDAKAGIVDKITDTIVAVAIQHGAEDAGNE